LQQLLLGPRQGIQPRGDYPVNRLRQFAGDPPLREHPHVLLGEQRVSSRTVEHRPLLLGELKRSL